MFKLLTSLALVLTLFTGCNSAQPEPTAKKGEPSWVLNPNQNGVLGAIGVAGRTYDQKISTQRKLAITRALDELSLQQGVKVQMSMTKRDKVTKHSSSMSMDSKSTYTTNNSVTAHIEDMYKDKMSGEIYVWMVMD